ncbi:MAG: DUF4157 domain-containing protein [Anaerolineaceae bacterium]|nr:DUF4157 domain-containing protein [Anaerolineaceae bacterium]
MNHRLQIDEPAFSILTEFSFAPAFLETIQIHNANWLAKWITSIFASSATTIGRRIYYAPTYYKPSVVRGIALLAHELVHVRQWQEEGLRFLFRYTREYLVYRREQKNRERHGETLSRWWAHDQISYEREGLMMEANVRQTLKERGILPY